MKNLHRYLPMTSYYPVDHPTYEMIEVALYLNDDNTHGEIVHCLVKPMNADKCDDTNCFDETIAILCNVCGIDSGITFLNGLYPGQIVPIKFQGEFDPEIPREWLKEQPWVKWTHNKQID
jgi:hypothetical protein